MLNHLDLVMDDVVGNPTKHMLVGLNAANEEEYASVSKLLQEFTNIPTIDKAWTFKSKTGIVYSSVFIYLC